ncbi:phytoene/squalene synthase family protein [Candidatus Albibeggiatoa sp. nov. NOAA]|uniref:phytoene/squalene synthase family protein n=1 Tax=Candidatus Albibeggiatoa sp. nov. NOAA TaxID=3162724 RepID=UPI0032FFA432|nr:phytoene/squalene synthase family protein [Thiotrichaceae bacterium]
MTISAEETYQTQILQGVSRTFALTIPQLPPELCKVVSNGYLLCRIADTIEDEPALTAQQKQTFSQQFVQVVAGETDAQQFSQALHPLLSDSTIDAEKDLIQNTDKVIALTHRFNPQQQAALLRCVRIMAKGMAEFQQNSSPTGLADLNTMSLYCYYVAGVVGEMLTQIFCDYSPEIAKHEAELHKLSISVGQALQMTNILKDVWDDLQRGACWLPQDVFQQHGFDLHDLAPQQHNAEFAAGLGHLIAVARTHIHNGLRYTLLIPKHETGIRRFCLWALGMAILTLRNINHQRHFSSGQQVKISRRSVKATIITTNLLTRSDSSLKLLYSLSTRPLPSEQAVDLDALWALCNQHTSEIS